MTSAFWMQNFDRIANDDREVESRQTVIQRLLGTSFAEQDFLLEKIKEDKKCNSAQTLLLDLLEDPASELEDIKKARANVVKFQLRVIKNALYDQTVGWYNKRPTRWQQEHEVEGLNNKIIDLEYQLNLAKVDLANKWNKDAETARELFDLRAKYDELLKTAVQPEATPETPETQEEGEDSAVHYAQAVFVNDGENHETNVVVTKEQKEFTDEELLESSIAQDLTE